MNERRQYRSLLVGSAVFSLGLAAPAAVGQAVGQAEGTSVSCIPVAERAGREFGCFIIATRGIGHLAPGRAFWHLSSFSTRSQAELARGTQGAVVESLGRVWLLAIADSAWRPAGGTRVAEIGPLPVTPDVAYTAQYMEAVFRPGMKSLVHRHSGPEAWYTLAGETCLETPGGTMIGVPGRPVIVPAGPPMELTATGTEVRRALVLILHDSEQPATSPARDWSPKGLCKG
jgi:quercetin dioxygenase-like cupin family protein